MIAFLAYPLQNPRHANRLHTIFDSCEPKVLLGTQDVIAPIAAIDSLSAIEKVAIESLLAANTAIDFEINPVLNRLWLFCNTPQALLATRKG